MELCLLTCQPHRFFWMPNSASPMCTVCTDIFSPDSTVATLLEMLPPGSQATWIQSNGIYIDMVKLTLGNENLSFSFPGWYFQFEIATLHLRAFLPFKCSVVLQHLRNSQGPLIFI